ncbi:MAG: ABC transporter permease subunit [Pseudomonadota bacterium]|nr:ABC transporter permease subunit [Pseudomonadota bacterium]
MSGRQKSILIQSAVLLILLLLAAMAIYNASINLTRLNLSFGFNFLWYRSGFPMGESWVIATAQDSNAWLTFSSMINTIVMSIYSIFFATLLGAILAFLSYYPNALLRSSAFVYIEIFRNIPLVIQMLFWLNVYYRTMPKFRESWVFYGIYLNRRGIFLPHYPWYDAFGWLLMVIFIGTLVVLWARQRYALSKNLIWSVGIWLGLVLVYSVLFESLIWPKFNKFRITQAFQIWPEFIGVSLGLILYTSAYIAESIRGCIQSVSKGQYEAARSFGMSEGYIYRKIILPQAMPAIMPQLNSQYLNVIKNTSLGVAVGYPEIFSIFAGTILNQTGSAIEIILLVMIFYLCIATLMSVVFQRINKQYEIWMGVIQK